MASSFSWHLFEQAPVIGILRGFGPDQVEPLVAAARRGGLTTVEVTMNTPGAPAQIAALAAAFGDDLNVGAGTVCTPDDLSMARAAGAQFIVTPVCVPEVIRTAADAGLVVAAGALTPTEIHQAHAAGAHLIKVFPAGAVGPGYVRAVLGPLDHLRLVPTGGVNAETIAAYHAAGAFAYGVGGSVFTRERVDAGDWPAIEAEVRRLLQTLQEARQ
jgi:2-dehydro-3-deoxyphosphogluconate aldolase/(4S)-4-hydroxy-2-oxoglutarate aldolase